MPCPFTPLLPFLASVPFLAWIRKKLGFGQKALEREVSTLAEELQSESDGGCHWSNDRSTSSITSFEMPCSLPIAAGLRWDIFPAGAPSFILKRALRVVETSGGAQAVLLTRTFRSPRSSIDSLADEALCKTILEAAPPDLFSFIRLEHSKIKARIQPAKIGNERVREALQQVRLLVAEPSQVP